MKIVLFSETYLPRINGAAIHVKTLKEGLEMLDHRSGLPPLERHSTRRGILRLSGAAELTAPI